MGIDLAHQLFLRRFLSLVNFAGDDECWEWQGSTDSKGYGIYGTQKAHKIAYSLIKGELPEGLIIRHICNNVLCVNTSHLISGTHKQNAEDKVRSGRWAGGAPPGEMHGRAKLLNSDIPVILQMYEDGYTQLEISRRYGIHRTGIARIVRGEGWLISQ